MSTPTSDTTTTDIKTWLTTNKLQGIEKQILESKITLKSLLEMTPEQLEQFGQNTLKLDVLSRKRLNRGVMETKQRRNEGTNNKNATVSSSTEPVGEKSSAVPRYSQQHVLISPQESKAFNALEEELQQIDRLQAAIEEQLSALDLPSNLTEKRTPIGGGEGRNDTITPSVAAPANVSGDGDEGDYHGDDHGEGESIQKNVIVNKTPENVQTPKEPSESQDESKVGKAIQGTVNGIITSIRKQVQVLEKECDRITKNKQQVLQQQYQVANQQFSELEKVKKLIDEYTAKKDKEKLSYLCKQHKNDTWSIRFKTQPYFKLNVNRELFGEMLRGMELDNCDQPKPPATRICMIASSSIHIEIKPTGDATSMEIAEIEIQYCIPPTDKLKRLLNQKERFLTNTEFQKEFGDVKWKTDDVYSLEKLEKISKRFEEHCRKKLKKLRKQRGSDDKGKPTEEEELLNQLNIPEESEQKKDQDSVVIREKYYCSIEKLRATTTYCLRVRAKNQSGWGNFGNIIYGTTSEQILAWNQAFCKSKGLLVEIKKDGKECKWTSTNFQTVPCNITISKKDYKKFTWEYQVRNIPSNGTCVGFIMLEKGKTLDQWTNYNSWCGSPGGSTSSLYFSTHSTYYKYDNGVSTNITLPTPKEGDKFRFALDWKKSHVEVFHNGKRTDIKFNLIGESIVPAASNNGTSDLQVSVKHISDERKFPKIELKSTLTSTLASTTTSTSPLVSTSTSTSTSNSNSNSNSTQRNTGKCGNQ